MAFSDWSTTAGSNTTVGGVSTAEGMNPSDVNNAIRAVMADAKAALGTKGADIASATTTDLGAVAGLSHDITGTTTITGFGTIGAGILKVIKFEGALTLTHNATSLILPHGLNITTADGDVAVMVSEGSGNWRCVSYLPIRKFLNPEHVAQTLSDGATINWDMNSGAIATITLGGNRTMAAPSNLKVGTALLHVIQDGTGSRTITWNSVFKWSAATAPTLTTTASRRDVMSFVCDGTNLYGSYTLDVR